MDKNSVYTLTVLVSADKIPFNHHNLKYFSLARNMCSFISCPFNCSVERGVGVSVWGLENGDLLGFSRDGVILGLDEGLGSWP